MRHAFRDIPADSEAAQQLRYRAFIGAGEARGLDADQFDEICHHVLVEKGKTGRFVCCFRLLPLDGGSEIGRSYVAQYYELSALQGF